MGSFSIWHWVVVLVFGTKKLRNIGDDLGSAVKGFKKGMQEGKASAGRGFLATVLGSLRFPVTLCLA